MRFLNWFYSGLHIKRWLALALLGVLIISGGISLLFQGQLLGRIEGVIQGFVIKLLGLEGAVTGGIILMLLGGVLLIAAFRGAVRALLRAAFPEYLHNQVRSIYQRHYLRRGPRIVVVGGGTGLSVLLRGLKEYTSNITAIVSVTDDGGSSGRLRGQFGILPPGDLRNCLVALADTEPMMERLFEYRFHQGKELEGHNLGNLLITAMADITGSFETAIHETSKVLAIRGRVLPSTLDNIILAGELEDGSMVRGESLMSQSVKPIKRVFTIPANSTPLPEALEAIAEADAIILGPGSLYTSVIPNLLVPGVKEAIQRAQGIKVYVCNVMTQPGETREYSASLHLKALYRHSTPDIVDYMILNNQEIPVGFKKKYAEDGARPVEIDKERLSKLNIRLITAPLIYQSDYIRHDSHKLARLILRLVLQKRGINAIERHLVSEKLGELEDD